jgi:hypothetical protein
MGLSGSGKPCPGNAAVPYEDRLGGSGDASGDAGVPRICATLDHHFVKTHNGLENWLPSPLERVSLCSPVALAQGGYGGKCSGRKSSQLMFQRIANRRGARGDIEFVVDVT